VQDWLVALALVGGINLAMTAAFFVYIFRRVMTEHRLEARIDTVERSLLETTTLVRQGISEMRQALEAFHAVREREEALPEAVSRLGELVGQLDDKLEKVVNAEYRIETLARVIEHQGVRLRAIEKKGAG
jgi:signal transduction histidine kinase